MMELLQTFSVTPIGEMLAIGLGLIWGSFFNVCIYRIPQGLDIVFKHSFCPRCEAKVKPQHNIPVLSYIWLRGKCAHCEQKISIQYPLVELLSGGLFLLTYCYYGWTLKFISMTTFLSALLVVSVIDIHLRIIPDEISLSGIVIGFLLSFVPGDITWWQSLSGLLVGGGIFFMIAFTYEKMTKREGLGGGDVKLLAMIGAWLGVQSILPVILISSALGSVIGVSYMLVKRGDFKLAIPFGPFLSVGAFFYAIWGKHIHLILFPAVEGF